MRIGDFDFGAEDARNLDLQSADEKRIFLDSFVKPKRFGLEDFYEGKKYFVYGPKGAGKTALLQYIRIFCEDDLNAITSFYHFQSTFSDKEIAAFSRNSVGSEAETVLDDSQDIGEDESAMFWRLFLLVEVSKLLKRAKVTEGAAEKYRKAMEAAKLIAKSQNVARRYPAISSFHLRLSRDPAIEIDGTFEDATPEDLETWLSTAESFLEDVYLEQVPLFLFVDEMEIYRRGNRNDELRLVAIAALVRAIRNFNERFVNTDIRVVAAIRREVADEVSVVQGEVHRIVRDRGLAIGWDATIHTGFHPLEKMVLGRMVVQDPDFHPYNVPITDKEYTAAHSRYFEKDFGLRNCLNLTWYRPRDLALLFEIAASIDEEERKFRKRTLNFGVVADLGTRLWQDAVSGLAVKYSSVELKGIDRVLRSGPEKYTKSALFERCEELSHSYNEVGLLSDTRWLEVIEDLYKVGVVYSEAISTGHKNFYFRGDPIPTLTENFIIGIHQTLHNELQIVK